MRFLKGLAVIAIAGGLTASAYATCTNPQGTCVVGPGVSCTQMLYDTQFSQWNTQDCLKWVGSGWTSYHVDGSGDDYWEIQSWGGDVYQQFTVPSDSDSMDVSAVIYLVKTSPGSEKIVVELTNTSGTVLQSLGTYYASSTGTTISLSTEVTPLPGQTVRLRFRVTPGSTPGDTLFHVTQAYVRASNLP